MTEYVVPIFCRADCLLLAPPRLQAVVEVGHEYLLGEVLLHRVLQLTDHLQELDLALTELVLVEVEAEVLVGEGGLRGLVEDVTDLRGTPKLLHPWVLEQHVHVVESLVWVLHEQEVQEVFDGVGEG